MEWSESASNELDNRCNLLRLDSWDRLCIDGGVDNLRDNQDREYENHA